MHSGARVQESKPLSNGMDKSSNRNRVLPSMVLIGSGQLLTGRLRRLHLCGPLKRYRSALPGPLWACVCPGQFYDSLL
ncbi:hypothetical protein AVEN_82757-1 [Araneus ventricosus]|uniref:Uncharacterized protein n=1 Tax=Araneus ventricosus TaxID=182803 RepID=A0A4Y2E9N8_ARAVE|nr:hypothetical protein AVEN_82757-1 [Araneus ventricosus]